MAEDNQYDDNMRFALFKQDKGDNPKRPDYSGTIKVEGKEYRLAAWISESRNGLKYLRGNVDETVENRLAAGKDEPAGLDATDEVPF